MGLGAKDIPFYQSWFYVSFETWMVYMVYFLPTNSCSEWRNELSWIQTGIVQTNGVCVPVSNLYWAWCGLSNVLWTTCSSADYLHLLRQLQFHWNQQMEQQSCEQWSSRLHQKGCLCADTEYNNLRAHPVPSMKRRGQKSTLGPFASFTYPIRSCHLLCALWMLMDRKWCQSWHAKETSVKNNHGFFSLLFNYHYWKNFLVKPRFSHLPHLQNFNVDPSLVGFHWQHTLSQPRLSALSIILTIKLSSHIGSNENFLAKWEVVVPSKQMTKSHACQERVGPSWSIVMPHPNQAELWTCCHAKRYFDVGLRRWSTTLWFMFCRRPFLYVWRWHKKSNSS